MHRGGLLLAHLLTLALPIASAAAQDGEPSWTVLRPTELHSEGGATLTVEGDGAIRATGTNPDKDVHVLTVETDLQRITGFRLEVLPHRDLRAKGPGRSRNGNFILNEFSATIASLEIGKPRAVVLGNATASHSQNGWPVTGAVDGIPRSGWAIAPRAGTPQHAVIETQRDAGMSQRSRLVFRLSFQHGSQHSLGHYRLCATRAPRPLRAQMDPDSESWHKFQEKINRAIDRGVQYLVQKQELDGSWSSHQPTQLNGMTGLAVYALLKSEVPPENQAVQRGVRFMRNNFPRHTYSISCQILALCALGGTEHDAWLQKLVDQLIAWQKRDGGFGYPSGQVDLSNTQYAALAMRAAAKKGLAIPATAWHWLALRTLRHMQQAQGAYDPAGYAYRIGQDPTGSMTSAGVGILAICAEHLERPPLPPRKQRAASGAVAAGIRRGVDWLGRHFSVSTNPPVNSHWNWIYYYLYGLERVGGLLGQELIGGHDWYREGARFIVPKQAGDGSWASGGNEQPNTAFALLFLTRATAPASGQIRRGLRTYGGDDPKVDVSLRASGDTPLTIWVSSWGKSVREELTWPGERGPELRVARVDFLLAEDDLLNAGANHAGTWRHTLRPPGKNWAAASFDDSGWQAGPLFFPPPRRRVEGARLWARRAFTIQPTELLDPLLRLRVLQRSSAQAAAAPPLAGLFEENEGFPGLIGRSEAGGQLRVISGGAHRGQKSLVLTPRKRLAARVPGWNFPIARNPGEGQYRYLRFAWRKNGGGGIALHLADRGGWAAPRYQAGPDAKAKGPAIDLATSAPSRWVVVTRDLSRDLPAGAVVTGLALTAAGGGEAHFDGIYLARSLADFRAIPDKGRALDDPAAGNPDSADPVRVHLNGVAVFDAPLETSDFEPIIGGPELIAALRPGRNVIALNWPRGELEQLVELRLNDARMLASATGDPERNSIHARFARQITFPRPGSYRIFARAHVQPPPEGDGAPLPLEALESPPLEVEIIDAVDERHLEYASDPARNLLVQAGATVRASSQYSKDWSAANAKDNLQGRAWLSRDDDPLPHITFDLHSPIRANQLLLSHANQDRGDAERTTRARLIAVTLNARGPQTVIEMAPSDLEKTVWTFPRPLLVRRIEIRVLATSNAHPTKRGVGFGEVELQRRR